ncbi:MAG TPA: DUF5995 family protein [Ilumatobacteraceae bacterium]|nr:DUF5995 family protein [Ilumatobacteraceae bacterium]
MIADTAKDLRGIALAATDASGYFAALYARVTARIGASIADATFADGPRLDRFATGFASLYIDASRDPSSRSGCWQASWKVVTDPRVLIEQHLLLGINAHVNYDLPRAVVAAADERGDLASIRPDFEMVNTVLAATYVDVVKALGRVSRWANAAARLGGGNAFNFSLRAARAQAWQAATRMYPMSDGARRGYVGELDRGVSVLAYLITQPSPVLRPFIGLARRLEEHDRTKVVAALLGER